jgi:hypothetical protein
MSKHFLSDNQVEAIKSRKIDWAGSMASCGHIHGSYSWGDGVISWSVMGEGGSIRMREQGNGIDAVASKLELIAKKEIESAISKIAEKIENEILNA